MGDSFVVTGLIAKRAELAGLQADLERQCARLRADLIHVDSTLHLFAPDADLAAIKPKQPIPRRSLYFAMGEVTTRIRDALRQAKGEPLSAEDIAVAAMTDKGLDVADSRLRADFIRRILWGLKRLVVQDKVARIGSGRGVLWKLVD